MLNVLRSSPSKEHRMPDTDQNFRDVLARLDALEHDNTQLKGENHTLRAQVATLEATVHPAPTPMPTPSPLEQLSRRWVLRRGMQAAAATVVAGVLVQRKTQEAHATHSSTIVDAIGVYAHVVDSANDGSSYGVYGATNSDPEGWAGVHGQNNGAGPGLVGKSLAGVGVIGKGVNGVRGESTATGKAASYGMHTGAGEGYGVIGDAAGSSGVGVLGRHTLGTGVRGEGKTGVHGKATSGNGVFGESGSGYGAVLKGGRAAIRLVPATTVGKPTTGNHQIGELYLDKVGTLFICTAAGTPGIWKKVTVS